MKYVKCDNCGKPIYFGSSYYSDGTHCGVYCSAQCFYGAYYSTNEMDEDAAENSACEIFETE